MSDNWFKKHADTLVILGASASSFLLMNGKFNELERDMTIIKTVLVMKHILAAELAKGDSSDLTR